MKKLLAAIVLVQSLALSQTTKGIVTGRIVSAAGAPVAGVRVAAVAQGAGGAVAASVLDSITQTDSSGTYRLENVTPDNYYIMAGLVDLPTYFPGVKTQAEAKAVAVAAGMTVSNIDFRIVQPLSSKVSGRVTGAAPQIPIVSLLPAAPPTGPLPLSATIKPDGSFEFAGVLPGTYRLQTMAARPVTIIVSDRDVSGVELVVTDMNAVTRQQGLKQVWSVKGAFGGVAGDSRTGAIYASGPANAVLELDLDGKLQRTIQSSTSFPTLRLARFTRDGGPGFLRFGTWSQEVRAYDNSDKLIWTYPPIGQGVDDVWPVDLDGDGLDEVIVGFNGNTGLHVLNRNGEVLWKVTNIGNVWHVTGGDLGGGKTQVVTTSAAGRIHFFDSDGSNRRDVDPGIYSNMVRISEVPGKPATIVAAGSSPAAPNAVVLAAVSADGAKQWSLNLESNLAPSAYSASAAPGKPWLAVGMQGGHVYVVDVERGAVIASIDGQGVRPDVTWASDKNSGAPLLIIAAAASLNAYAVEVKQ